MAGRLLVLLMALAVAGVSFAASRGDETPAANQPAATKTPVPAPAGALRIDLLYSPEKRHLVPPLVESFNGARVKVGGRVVHVDASEANSGDVEDGIASGKLHPVAWSPASSLWGQLLNHETDKPFAPRNSPSIVRSPLVIAMWEPMARALGWPRKPIGFGDLLRLAKSKRGWAAYHRPEFGPFRLVHTNPEFSTSGLSAVVAEYHAASGSAGPLTAAEVRHARPVVRDLERSITHYGDATPYVAERMKIEGMSYASAAAMEEVTMLDFNTTRGDRDRLVAIYPKEGTFYSDNPFIVLDAPWVDADKRRAAEAFRRYVLDHVGASEASRYNFRPARGPVPADSPISAANGADPSEPRHLLELPTSRVLASIRTAWRHDRKPADILLAVDISNSMNQQDRLERAKAGLRAFLAQSEPQDRVGLLAFSDIVKLLVPIRPLREDPAQLERTVDGLVSTGGTSLYDAVNEAVGRVAALGGKDRIKAVVVLSDGQDVDSKKFAVLNDLLKRLETRSDDPASVRVYTIGYSTDAAGSKEALEKISATTGGKYFDGSNTQDIESVYRTIASFF